MNIMLEIHKLKKRDIDAYIESRLSKLRNKEKNIVGLNSSNYVYNGFFDENVRLNIFSTFKYKKGKTIMLLGGICVNDVNIYKELIDACQYVSNPYLAIYLALENYFRLNSEERRIMDDDMDVCRYYYAIRHYLGKDKCISIKKFRDKPVAQCTEISAVTQSMLKFLGIDSDFIIGESDGIPHAYNIIYPRGRKADAVLFDGTYRFGSEPVFLYLTSENRTKLYSGETITLTEKENKRGTKYLFGEKLDDFDPFEFTYSISNIDYVDDERFNPDPDRNEGKYVFENYYKGSLVLKNNEKERK